MADMRLLPHGEPTLSDANEFYIFAKDFFNRITALLNVKEEDLI